jgi:hypothetical protein
MAEGGAGSGVEEGGGSGISWRGDEVLQLGGETNEEGEDAVVGVGVKRREPPGR